MTDGESPEQTYPSKIGRQLDGRFAPGNNANPTGRPVGSKHKATLAIEALLEGDTTALRLCLERLAPPAKSHRVSIDLPKLEVPQDLIAALSKVIEAMGAGELAPDEAAIVCGVLEAKRKAIEMVEFERRLAALEQKGEQK